MIITTRFLNHLLDGMRNHTYTWCLRSTERFEWLLYYFLYTKQKITDVDKYQNNEICNVGICFRSRLNTLNLD